MSKSPQVSPDNPAFPRDGFTVSFVIFAGIGRGSGFLAPVIPEKR